MLYSPVPCGLNQNVHMGLTATWFCIAALGTLDALGTFATKHRSKQLWSLKLPFLGFLFMTLLWSGYVLVHPMAGVPNSTADAVVLSLTLALRFCFSILMITNITQSHITVIVTGITIQSLSERQQQMVRMMHFYELALPPLLVLPTILLSPILPVTLASWGPEFQDKCMDIMIIIAGAIGFMGFLGYMTGLLLLRGIIRDRILAMSSFTDRNGIGTGANVSQRSDVLGKLEKRIDTQLKLGLGVPIIMPLYILVGAYLRWQYLVVHIIFFGPLLVQITVSVLVNIQSPFTQFLENEVLSKMGMRFSATTTTGMSSHGAGAETGEQLNDAGGRVSSQHKMVGANSNSGAHVPLMKLVSASFDSLPGTKISHTDLPVSSTAVDIEQENPHPSQMLASINTNELATAEEGSASGSLPIPSYPTPSVSNSES